MNSPIKWAAISVGGVVAIAHIGILGHLVRKPQQVQIPQINIPAGTPYSSYKIEAGKDGYTIEYRANDPKVLESTKSLDLNKSQSGFFGGKKYEDRKETRYDQYTMEGVRNMGGASLPGGKSASDIECIVADAGARSQGAMAGTAISTGLIAPAVMNIPYIGWLASGWAMLLGNKAGSEIGSEVGSVFNDC